MLCASMHWVKSSGTIGTSHWSHLHDGVRINEILKKILFRDDDVLAEKQDLTHAEAEPGAVCG